MTSNERLVSDVAVDLPDYRILISQSEALCTLKRVSEPIVWVCDCSLHAIVTVAASQNDCPRPLATAICEDHT